MKDESQSIKSLLDSTTGDYILQMDPESTVSSTPIEQKNSTDVCYPYPISSGQLLDEEVMNRFMESPVEYDLKEELTAKLDDLLDENKGSDTTFTSIKRQNEDLAIQDRYTFYSPDLGTLQNPSFRQLLHSTTRDEKKTVAELLKETTNWWIDIHSPSNEEMRAISKIFRLHPLTTEDIQAQESREKCELFQHYMFINFRTYNQDFNSPNYLDAINFYIIVFKEGVLTFRFHALSHPQNVRRRIHQLKDFILVTPEWINYALIDNITDGFAPLIQQTEIEVDSIDDLVLVLNGSEQTDMLRRIGSCRKTVMQLLRLLGSKADVLRSLIKQYTAKEMEQTGLDFKAHHEVTLYLGDIQDHIITMLQNTTHYDLILGRAHRNYLGQITIELSQAGNTTNEVINRLTFLATIIIPLNLIGSLFGMNVYVPGQDEKDLVWFYWVVLGMLIYVVASLAIGKRIGFL
ncbi:unnamed protein product [Rhizopus stolonifer]